MVCSVYDITKDDTFEHLDDWHREIENNADADTLIYLLGNMKDKEDERQVGKIVGKNKAEELGYKYFMETSAKTKEGIEEVFIRAVKELYFKNKDRLNQFAEFDDGMDSQSVDQRSEMILSDGRKSSVHLSRATFTQKPKKKWC